MTKAELVEKMADDAGITKVAAAAALDSFTANVAKALKKKDGKVTLVGFGTFMKVRRKARKGRNPQTGDVIKIKAANVVKFRPGKKLRESVYSFPYYRFFKGGLPGSSETDSPPFPLGISITNLERIEEGSRIIVLQRPMTLPKLISVTPIASSPG
jgi:DNA-binding protein HU-beta